VLIFQTLNVVARDWGEEYIILMLETGGSGALPVAGPVKQSIIDCPFSIYSDQSLRLTIRFGVATISDENTAPGILLKCADIALFAAKRSGHSQVKVWQFKAELI
jgi:diguanylate cyclase (GGDEF)-like protein